MTNLEGDALNVALLVPEVQRATWSGLAGALSDHYRSPGRLAILRPKFETAARRYKEVYVCDGTGHFGS